MYVVHAAPSTNHEIEKKPGINLPERLLDQAVTRLCFVSFISAVSTVAFFAAHGLLQAEAAEIQKNPMLRLAALASVLLSIALIAAQRAGWFSKQTIVHL